MCALISVGSTCRDSEVIVGWERGWAMLACGSSR
jgi:hypothetical protein